MGIATALTATHVALITVVAGLHDFDCPGPPDCKCVEVPLLLAPEDPTLGFPKPPMRPPKEPTRLRSRPKLLPPAVRSHVLMRAGYRCERCHVPGRLDVHHRLNRSQGGSDDPDNLAALCRPCHEFVTSHPKEARAGGWTL